MKKNKPDFPNSLFTEDLYVTISQETNLRLLVYSGQTQFYVIQYHPRQIPAFKKQHQKRNNYRDLQSTRTQKVKSYPKLKSTSSLPKMFLSDFNIMFILQRVARTQNLQDFSQLFNTFIIQRVISSYLKFTRFFYKVI